MIDDSEKNNETEIECLLNKKKTQLVRFIIINELSYVSDSIKKIHIDCPIGLSLMGLKRKLSKEFTVAWKEIKVVANRELRDYENGRTLEELKLNPGQVLTISRKIISSYQEVELIHGDKFNPKAVRCFKVIFNKFSTNKLMSKDQCNSFTAKCLGTHKYYT